MQPRPKRARQRDVAEAAGVSISTVSRILNPRQSDNSKWASPSTVQIVKDTAERLGYRRNAYASALRTHRTDAIGVLLADIRDPALAAIYMAIEDAASAAGITTYGCNTRDEMEQQLARADSILSHRVDGLIICDARGLPDATAPRLENLEVPFVLAHRVLAGEPDFRTVTIDDYTGGRLAADHLIELGRTHPAIAGGLPNVSNTDARTKGFLDRCAESNIHVPDRWIIHNGNSVYRGRRAGEQLFSEKPYPDAVFCLHDAHAFGLWAAGTLAGLTVPDDLAIVGYYSIPAARMSTMPLTSIETPLAQLGAEAFRVLRETIDGGNPDSVVLPPVLRPRATTIGLDAYSAMHEPILDSDGYGDRLNP